MSVGVQMPSSKDRRRLEVPPWVHEQLKQIAARESRTVASVANELLFTALSTYRSGWVPKEHLHLLNPRARQVLELAKEEAHALDHNYIGTEHLLLGLMREVDGAASGYLTGRGVEIEQVREQILKLIGRGNGSEWPNIEMTPRTRRVLAFAVDHVQRHGHVRVGTDHLLVGLAQEGQGVAAGILERFGVDLDQLRQWQLTTLSQLE
jgi:hypothetical protein